MKSKNFQAGKAQSAALLAWAQEKTADIRYRVELKDKPWIVVYKVRSSDDTQDYDVTVVHGKVNNCTCPARKPCYHMRDVQAREDERVALEHRIEQDIEQHVEDEFPRLSREAYIAEFGIYE